MVVGKEDDPASYWVETVTFQGRTELLNFGRVLTGKLMEFSWVNFYTKNKNHVFLAPVQLSNVDWGIGESSFKMPAIKYG